MAQQPTLAQDDSEKGESLLASRAHDEVTVRYGRKATIKQQKDGQDKGKSIDLAYCCIFKACRGGKQRRLALMTN
jgi:hypothetical protein